MTKGTLRQLLDAFCGRRVLVLGDVIRDEYLLGEVKRSSPEAPVPVVEIQRHNHVPGGAANAAANVAALGGVVYLGGVVGADGQARDLRDTLDPFSIHCDGLMA